MYTKVKQAQRIIDLIMYSYIVLVVILLFSLFIQFGIAEGVYRLITFGIGTITAIVLLSSIKEGKTGARIIQGSSSLISAALGFYTVFSGKLSSNIIGFISFLLISLYFLACGVFLLFSPQVNAINKYYKQLHNVKWYWSWKGKCIGYLDQGYLWKHDGTVIGRFVEDDIYNPKGQYIGELYRNNNRLCFDKNKSNQSSPMFDVPELNHYFDKQPDTSPMVLYGGYEDFSAC